MKIRTADNDRKFYSSIFLTLTLTIVITILTLSTILYLNFENIALKQIFTYTMNNLEQTSQSASVMAVSAGTFAKQIYNDINISKLIYFPSPDVMDITAGLTQLNNYRATSPFIDSIYVYDTKTGTFYISSEAQNDSVQNEHQFYDREIVDIVRDYEKYQTLMPIPRRILAIGQDLRKEEKDCYTFLMYDTLTQRKVNYIVIVNVLETQMHKNIDGMFSNYEDNTFIIDNKGVLVTNSWKYPMLSDISYKSYIKRILSTDRLSNYFVGDVDGAKSFVTYTQSDYLGWRYIRIVPYKTIINRINHMKFLTIVIGGAILVFGLLFSLLVSRKLSLKVDEKLEKLRMLEKERRDGFHKLRQDFVRNLLLEWDKFDPETIKSKFKHFRIQLDPEGKIRIVLFKIDHFKSFTNEYNCEDRNLFKFGITNIIEDILSEHYLLFALDMGDDRIVVLVNPCENTPLPIGHDFKTLIGKIQESVLDYLKVSLSAIVSPIGDSIYSHSTAYRQVLEASFHRLFYGHGCILYAEDIEKLKIKQYVYPAQKEKQLVDVLMLGRIDEAKRIFKEIVEATADYAYIAFNMTISHLTFTINSAVYTILRNNFIPAEYDINGVLAYINEAEKLEEVYNHFFKIFDYLNLNLEVKKNAKHDEVVNKIIGLIDKQYMHQDLSIDSIAESLGLSATHLGRLFKKSTLKTILDYIIEVRMNKAKELLLSTTNLIGEIAEKTGFSDSTYFHKTFKKINGVTPSEFRKNNKMKTDSKDNEEEF